MEPSTEQSLDLLRDSLNEAQATVRSYDTKAQIVGIGYIFALGIVGKFEAWFPQSAEIDVIGHVLVGWGVVILPILLFGFVLYPSRKRAPKLASESVVKLEHILYLDPDKLGDVAKLKAAVARCDPGTEVAFELLKMAKLRELKRQRFLRALFAAGFCFIVLFASQLTRGF